MCSKKRKKVLTFIHFIRKMEFGKKELVQEKKIRKPEKSKIKFKQKRIYIVIRKIKESELPKNY